jgi:hypothetical protein
MESGAKDIGASLLYSIRLDGNMRRANMFGFNLVFPNAFSCSFQSSNRSKHGTSKEEALPPTDYFQTTIIRVLKHLHNFLKREGGLVDKKTMAVNLA